MMKRKRYICPHCGASAGATIFYGMPIWEQVEADVEQGYLILGGCDQSLGAPERACTACGHQWRIRRKRPGDREWSQPVPDYFLLRLYLEASIEAPYVEWRDGRLSKGRELYDRVVCPDPGEAAWRSLWERLSDASVDVWGWKSRYDNRYVLDGLSWELEIRLGDVVKRCSGSNAYPNRAGPEWERSARFVALLEAVSKFARDRDLWAAVGLVL